MDAVAAAAEAIHHYPEWSDREAAVDIILTTRDLEGLSQHEAALAERIDELAVLFGADQGYRLAPLPDGPWSAPSSPAIMPLRE